MKFLQMSCTKSHILLLDVLLERLASAYGLTTFEWHHILVDCPSKDPNISWMGQFGPLEVRRSGQVLVVRRNVDDGLVVYDATEHLLSERVSLLVLLLVDPREHESSSSEYAVFLVDGNVTSADAPEVAEVFDALTSFRAMGRD